MSNNLTYDLHPEVFLVECVPPSPPKPAFNIKILCKNEPQWCLHEGKEGVSTPVGVLLKKIKAPGSNEWSAIQNTWLNVQPSYC